MEKIQFDSGIREFCINGGGVLRFNPADPNLYERFLEAMEKIRALEAEMMEQAKTIPQETAGEGVIRIMAETDRKIKEQLNTVFGHGNDFGVLLEGVNLLAVGGNGERVVTNLFAALQPILEEGAKLCAREKTEQAVSKARARRAKQ